MALCCCFDDEPSAKPQYIIFISAVEKAGATSVMRRVLNYRQGAMSSSPAVFAAAERSVVVPTIRDFEMIATAVDPQDSPVSNSSASNKKGKKGEVPFTLVDVGRPLRAELLASLMASSLPQSTSSATTSPSLNSRSCSNGSVASAHGSLANSRLRALLMKATGVVFVVDCADKVLPGHADGRQMLSYSQRHLFSALCWAVNGMSSERRAELSLYVAANKQDVVSSVSVREVVSSLGLKTEGPWPAGAPWTCQPSAALHPVLSPQLGILEFFCSVRRAAAFPSDGEESAADGTTGSALRKESWTSDAELTQRLSSPRAAASDPSLVSTQDSVLPASLTLGGEAAISGSRRRKYTQLDK
jgi:hypothetical protein